MIYLYGINDEIKILRARYFLKFELNKFNKKTTGTAEVAFAPLSRQGPPNSQSECSCCLTDSRRVAK